jgi:hypothetical protein
MSMRVAPHLEQKVEGVEGTTRLNWDGISDVQGWMEAMDDVDIVRGGGKLIAGGIDLSFPSKVSCVAPYLPR